MELGAAASADNPTATPTIVADKFNVVSAKVGQNTLNAISERTTPSNPTLANHSSRYFSHTLQRSTRLRLGASILLFSSPLPPDHEPQQRQRQAQEPPYVKCVPPASRPFDNQGREERDQTEHRVHASHQDAVGHGHLTPGRPLLDEQDPWGLREHGAEGQGHPTENQHRIDRRPGLYEHRSGD